MRRTEIRLRSQKLRRNSGRPHHSLRAVTTQDESLDAVGYGSSNQLYEHSNALVGMTPAKNHRRRSPMEISYALASSRIGRLLVAGTARGACAIYLGDSDGVLEATLRRKYPDARIRLSPASVSRWVQQLVRHLAGRQGQLRIPLDVQATAFQRRVWETLQRIPYGATRSYGEVARAIGEPKGARAVARACASNPVSVVIPCHRIVRENGDLGGYRWGILRKHRLLLQEKRRKKTVSPAA